MAFVVFHFELDYYVFNLVILAQVRKSFTESFISFLVLCYLCRCHFNFKFKSNLCSELPSILNFLLETIFDLFLILSSQYLKFQTRASKMMSRTSLFQNPTNHRPF